MLSAYDKSVTKLIQILDDRVKDHSCRDMLDVMKKDTNATESKFNILIDMPYGYNYRYIIYNLMA